MNREGGFIEGVPACRRQLLETGFEIEPAKGGLGLLDFVERRRL
jgi:hypothetical protein